jgi:hypothetical protein
VGGVGEKDKKPCEDLFIDSTLLNVSEEETATNILKKSGDMYQNESLVNKLSFVEQFVFLDNG